MTTLALTDHDTMDGVADATAAGARLGVRVVPGVELSARVSVGSMHLLGYFPDAAPPAVAARLAELREQRVTRARQMVDRLTAMGVRLEWRDVSRRAEGSIGRPHIADALVAAGHVADRAAAFTRYLSDDGPAYVPSAALDPEEAIRLVTTSGGAPVLAHPFSLRLGREALRRFVGDLQALGLRGIEVHRPDHDGPDTEFLRALAGNLGLVACGGSDFHRPDGPVELGDTGPHPLDGAVVQRLFTVVIL